MVLRHLYAILMFVFLNVSDLAYLRGNVCECCPFLVFAAVWCVCVFCVLSDVLVYVLLWVGNRSVGRCVGLLY